VFKGLINIFNHNQHTICEQFD